MNFLKTKRRLIVSLLLAIIIVTAGCTGLLDFSESISSYSHQADELAVHYLDVGQGDSILIQFPTDSVMLIDAGPDGSGAPVISYLKEQGIRKIDYLVATHPHADHIGGMAAVIAEFDIDKVYMPRVTHTTKAFEELLLSIKGKGLKITPACAGLNIIDQDDLMADFAAPVKSGYDSLNDYSAVVKVRFGSTSFIFTGDAEALSEKEMLASGADLKANVLKVAHHGSKSSTIPEFLQSVSPKYAVISVGKENKYGHPHQETLDNLAGADVAVYRTDLDGTIVFVSDGLGVRRFSR